jgi:hypothetical protein
MPAVTTVQSVVPGFRLVLGFKSRDLPCQILTRIPQAKADKHTASRNRETISPRFIVFVELGDHRISRK